MGCSFLVTIMQLTIFLINKQIIKYDLHLSYTNGTAGSRIFSPDGGGLEGAPRTAADVGAVLGLAALAVVLKRVGVGGGATL